MTIMKRKSTTSTTLVNNVIDKKDVARLEASRDEIAELRNLLSNHFEELKTSIVSVRSILAFFNGRTDKRNYHLAGKIIDKSEKDLFCLRDDLKFLDKTLADIDSIKSKVDQGKQTETRILNIEKFLNGDMTTGTLKEIEVASNFDKLNIEAKTLQHSVKALLELKAGES